MKYHITSKHLYGTLPHNLWLIYNPMTDLTTKERLVIDNDPRFGTLRTMVTYGFLRYALWSFE